jgi:DNA end-binding protein Ku
MSACSFWKRRGNTGGPDIGADASRGAEPEVCLMPVRALWKGVIRFGQAAVAVKFYAAVTDRTVRFRLLHKTDHIPVEQRMVDPRSGEPVPAQDIRRGYETADDRIILLDPGELAALEPEASREITITRFVDPALINHQWYDRPYYLGPDSGGRGYFELAEALAGQGREGIAHWTMRRKRYLGALGARKGYLQMITLRHAEEVIDAASLPRPQSRELNAQEMRMAEQLVRALQGDFDPQAFRESYRERVRELIRNKARGIEMLPPKKAAKRPETASLEESLRQSLAELKKERKSA